MKTKTKALCGTLALTFACAGTLALDFVELEMPRAHASTEIYTTWAEAGNAAVSNTDYTVDGNGNYTVYTAKGLAYIANVVNGGETLKGKSVTLANDIDLLDGGVIDYAKDTVNNTNSWTPIAAIGAGLEVLGAFEGTFDGNNYSISNLFMNTNAYHTGLFGFTVEAEICDLEIKGANITDVQDAAAAIVVTYSIGGVLSNIQTDEASVLLSYNGSNAAGIISYIEASATVKDCHNAATVTADYAMIVGGVVAQTALPKGVTEGALLLQGCSNSGAISGYDSVGGVLAWSSACRAEIKDCYNSGAVTGLSSMVGGIGGCLQSTDFSIVSSYNTGTVTGAYEVGGIVGNLYGGTQIATVKDCYNAGTVSAIYGQEKYSSAGGIIGVLHGENDVVSNCYNVGTISSQYTSSLGELIGTNKGTLKDCAYVNGKTAYGSTSTGTAQDNTGYTAEQFASGEVAYALNGGRSEDTAVWRQNVASDTAPSFLGGKVYKHDTVICAVYTNTADGGHGSLDGDFLCDVCGDCVHVHYDCGSENCTHTCSKKEYTALTKTLVEYIIENKEGYVPAGNYALVEDINVALIDGTLKIDEGIQVNLCLNGKTFDVFSIENKGGSTLRVCDCQAESVGTLNMVNSLAVNGITEVYGGNIDGTVNVFGILNIYGGTFIYREENNIEAIYIQESGAVWVMGGNVDKIFQENSDTAIGILGFWGYTEKVAITVKTEKLGQTVATYQKGQSVENITLTNEDYGLANDTEKGWLTLVHTAHTGGEATCTAQAICSICLQGYGDMLPHDYDNTCDTTCNVCNTEREIVHTPNADDGDCTTEITCSVCGTVTTEGKTAHQFGEDNVCDNCGYEKIVDDEDDGNVTAGCRSSVGGFALAGLALAACAIMTRRKEN